MACWWLRRDQARLTLHSGPPATRQLLTCQTCWCLLQIRLTDEGHTRPKPDVTSLRIQSCTQKKKKNMSVSSTRGHQTPKTALIDGKPVILHLRAAALTKSAQWSSSSLKPDLDWAAYVRNGPDCTVTNTEGGLLWTSPVLCSQVKTGPGCVWGGGGEGTTSRFRGNFQPWGLTD